MGRELNFYFVDENIDIDIRKPAQVYRNSQKSRALTPPCLTPEPTLCQEQSKGG